MNPVREIKSDLNALAVIRDWLGDGLAPVAPDVAQKRAFICAECPMNKPGNWWDKTRGLMADAIRRQMAVKRLENISTSLDDQLGTCKICSCNLALKVHVPAQHIRNHLLPEHDEQFPDFCWIKNL